MARPLRVEFPGALYHVTVRGNAGQDVFLNVDGRSRFLRLLGQTCARMRWRCHAYCLMTNHYHLVVDTPDGNLSRGMRQLNGIYTQAFNRVHDRVGHIFQGRYKAILIDRDGYLLEVCRYVVLNPVRAGMVEHPRDWTWSSYRSTVGETGAPVWLETDWLLGQFANSRRRARHAYARFVQQGGGPASLWDELRQQIYLGSERFVAEMQRHVDATRDLSEVPRGQRRPAPKSLAWYAQTFASPHEAMARAYLSGDYSQSAIASHFGVHYSSVSRAVRRHEASVGE